jgi:hypothetical protein
MKINIFHAPQKEINNGKTEKNIREINFISQEIESFSDEKRKIS